MNDPNEEVAHLLTQYSNQEMEELILRMRLYAQHKLGKKNDNFEGEELLDFVFGVFDKALSGIRNWDSKEYSFEEFLFGVLKSDVSNYFKKQKRKAPEKVEDDEIDESYILDLPVYAEEIGHRDDAFNLIDYDNQKKHFLELLENSGASTLEILIFECWCDDIYKSGEIAELLEVSTAEVYNATKRLKNRRRKLKKTL
ncbi:hypothetical protein ED312_08800 [Sinomicrobium pectinilyticum]|uniref:Sigma-70 family RNA polymerase sigma factor n=1 Tax=Sinomicrobium pectinilyticum TaxID=1084421 RepID=A0A3N0EKX7_SINP1|nr:hypothetical protein [Sinomicrobium pectinilyticum]RNL88535.1 hypothetical protein ED312_08800 [Sinomicrobium pectinilyticum]